MVGPRLWEARPLKRRELLALLAVGIVILVGLTARRCSRVRTLSHALVAARDGETLAEVVQELLDCGGRGRRALAEYAGTNDLAAFDPSRGLFVCHDQADGRTHSVYGGPHGEAPATGDASLDAAIDDVMSGMRAKESFCMGDPPILYREVVLAKSDEARSTFLLMPLHEDEDEPVAVDYQFHGDRLVGTRTYPPTDSQLEKWHAAGN